MLLLYIHACSGTGTTVAQLESSCCAPHAHPLLQLGGGGGEFRVLGFRV